VRPEFVKPTRNEVILATVAVVGAVQVVPMVAGLRPI
jgi:hypothetical protein